MKAKVCIGLMIFGAPLVEGSIGSFFKKLGKKVEGGFKTVGKGIETFGDEVTSVDWKYVGEATGVIGLNVLTLGVSTGTTLDFFSRGSDNSNPKKVAQLDLIAFAPGYITAPNEWPNSSFIKMPLPTRFLNDNGLISDVAVFVEAVDAFDRNCLFLEKSIQGFKLDNLSNGFKALVGSDFLVQGKLFYDQCGALMKKAEIEMQSTKNQTAIDTIKKNQVVLQNQQKLYQPCFDLLSKLQKNLNDLNGGRLSIDDKGDIFIALLGSDQNNPIQAAIVGLQQLDSASRLYKKFTQTKTLSQNVFDDTDTYSVQDAISKLQDLQIHCGKIFTPYVTEITLFQDALFKIVTSWWFENYLKIVSQALDRSKGLTVINNKKLDAAGLQNRIKNLQARVAKLQQDLQFEDAVQAA